MYDVKNFTSDKFYVISLLHLWNVVHWYIACSAWDELLKQLYHYYIMNKLNYGLFLISSHNTIRDKHEIVIQKKTFNKSINKTRNINQQTHNKTVL